MGERGCPKRSHDITGKIQTRPSQSHLLQKGKKGLQKKARNPVGVEKRSKRVTKKRKNNRQRVIVAGPLLDPISERKVKTQVKRGG